MILFRGKWSILKLDVIFHLRFQAEFFSELKNHRASMVLFFFWIFNQGLHPKNPIIPSFLVCYYSWSHKQSTSNQRKSHFISHFPSFETRNIVLKQKIIFSLYGRFILTFLQWGAGSYNSWKIFNYRVISLLY